MQINLIPEKLRRLEIPGRVEIANGHGGLPLVKIRTPWSTAEIYLLGAHVAGFQKNGEPPLIFMSAKSFFANGKPIRGGVPICYPWFGNRDGEPSHGFARSTEWQLVKTSAANDGSVTVTFALPQIPGREAWKSLRTEFIVTVADTLTILANPLLMLFFVLAVAALLTVALLRRRHRPELQRPEGRIAKALKRIEHGHRRLRILQ